MYPENTLRRYILEYRSDLKKLLINSDISQRFDKMMDIIGKNKKVSRYYDLKYRDNYGYLRGICIHDILATIHKDIFPFLLDEYTEIFKDFCKKIGETERIIRHFNESKRYRYGMDVTTLGPISTIEEYVQRVICFAPMDWFFESRPDNVIYAPSFDFFKFSAIDDSWFNTLRLYEETKNQNFNKAKKS